jgi:hypothetical protein
MSENGIDLFSDLLKPADEVHITVADEKNGDRVFVFDAMDAGTYRGYNDKITGKGRKRGDVWAAVRYLFERKCSRVEGLTEKEKAQLEAANTTAKAVMLGDKKYLPMIDQIIGRYVGVTVPDASSSKSDGEGD